MKEDRENSTPLNLSDVISRFFHKPLGQLPPFLPERMNVAFFVVSWLISGILWLMFAFVIPPEAGKFDSPMWFVFAAILPWVCICFGLIHWRVAWIALIGGYLTLGWFGLDDRAAFAQGMRLAFIIYLLLGVNAGLLIALLNKYCSSDLPKYCRNLRLRIEKDRPPPGAIDNCSNILNDLWDEVRAMPEGSEREELLANLRKLIDKVAAYPYNDTVDTLFNEPEIRCFKWWGSDGAQP